MNNHSHISPHFLLERSTKFALASAGVLLVVAGITAEKLILIVLGVLVGAGIIGLAFRGLPVRLTQFTVERRGELYLSFSAIFLPAVLSLSFGVPAGLLLIVLFGTPLKPPWDILLAGSVMGICAIANLVLLIMNGVALAKLRA